MTLYMKDDNESWADWISRHPMPSAVKPPYRTAEERDTALRYMAEYYNHILRSGGDVAIEATGNNPYVLTWIGTAGDGTRRLVSKDEALAAGPMSGGGITYGPSKPEVVAPVKPVEVVIPAEVVKPTVQPVTPQPVAQPVAQPAKVLSTVPKKGWFRRFIDKIKSWF